MRNKTVRILLIIIYFLITAFIFSNSLMDKEQSAKESSVIALLIKNLIDPNGKLDFDTFHGIIRKVAHFTEFFALGLCACGIRHSFGQIPKKKIILLPYLVSLATAVCDETIQKFTGRGSSICDVLLDFSGAFTSIILLNIFIFIFRKHER